MLGEKNPSSPSGRYNNTKKLIEATFESSLDIDVFLKKVPAQKRFPDQRGARLTWQKLVTVPGVKFRSQVVLIYAEKETEI